VHSNFMLMLMQLEELENSFSSLKEDLDLSRVPEDPLDVALCVRGFSRISGSRFLELILHNWIRDFECKVVNFFLLSLDYGCHTPNTLLSYDFRKSQSPIITLPWTCQLPYRLI
jgi:hypothetical protein